MSVGLYTNQIDCLLRTNKRTKHPYEGTYPCDVLKTIQVTKYPTCYIVNSDTSSGPGKHWLCVYLKSPKKAYFFDSYAIDVDRYKDIEQFIWKVSDPDVVVCQLSGKALQSNLTDVCGHWCIVFVDLLSGGVTFNDFVNIFSTPKNSRSGLYDDFVKQYVLDEFCKHCNQKHLRKKRFQKCVCKYLACCVKSNTAS